jgi:hypothetical protein
MPTQFMGKTWIFVAQAIFIGGLGVFGLMMGPLLLLEIIRPANGKPGTDAGIALSAISIPLLLVALMAVHNLRVRRNPLLRVCREGLEIVEVGASRLDKTPMIPGMIRVAWLILSGEGFRQKVTRIPWERFERAWVSGPPMIRRLIIAASLPAFDDDGFPMHSGSFEPIVLSDATFKTPLDQIADAINSRANSPIALSQLPSWDHVDLAK